MPEERICDSCGRANPIDQPRCINCGQRAHGTVLVAEKSPTASWWSGSTAHQGVIPPPPQVREEMQRAETIRLDEERRKTERERRAAEARERQARQVAQRQASAAATAEAEERYAVRERRHYEGAAPESQAVQATAVDCQRCGTPLEATASGQGFSFCLLCGAEAPAVTAQRLKTETQETVTKETYRPTYTGETSNVHSGVVNTAPKSTKSPVGAAIFSFILPGIGQCINGQGAKGALLLLVYFLASTVFNFLPIGIPMLIVRAVAAADAYRIADKRRKGVAVRDGEWDLG